MLITVLLALSLSQGDEFQVEAFAEAERRAPVAREAFRRARGVLDGWWATRDPVTGLLPRRTDQQVWAPGDNAADLYPFLVLSARFTRPELMGELLAIMSREVELTTRMGWLPDWYSITERRFLHEVPDVHRIVFGATEYAKDGLNPLIELDGPELWRQRMGQLLDGVFEVAPIASDFGPLPADGAEVNGELLQALTRFYFLTGEEKYMAWAERIGDAYCLEVLPQGGGLPAHHWSFSDHQATDDRFSLNDHGNEIVGGLAELYHAVKILGRPSAERYEAPLRRMFDILLEKARNGDGLWFTLLQPSTGEVLSDRTPDTWGYALAACVAFGEATGDDRYLEAARLALRGVHQERYLDWGGADSFADSIEGALLLLNRFPEPEGFAWLDEILPRFWAKQKLSDEGGTGIVEGWYGDGNYARTALMVAFYFTQGASVDRWNEHIQLGGERDGESLRLFLSSDETWSGKLRLDHPRHRDHFQLPRSHPRLNEFPEWFTVEAGELYGVKVHSSFVDDDPDERVRLGAELIAGVDLNLAAGEVQWISVTPLGEPPFGQERAPSDPFRIMDEADGDPAFVDAINLVEEGYAGESYRWTGRGPIEWTAHWDGDPVDSTLWLRWGSKGDLRKGEVSIAGRTIPVERGGYHGFEWVPFPVPASWWDKGQLKVRVEAPRGGGPAAFLSAMRLRRLLAPADEDQAVLQLMFDASNGRTNWVDHTLLASKGDVDATGALIETCATSAEQAHSQIAARQGDLRSWSKERARLRKRLAGALGLDPLPPRTPLKARVLGKLERDGYRVERLVFESRPGFPVTANVYVPAGTGPFPAVLCPVGHWGRSKAEDVVQTRCISLAKQGFIALTYDPFGQGERAVEGNSHYEYFETVLAGRNNMSWMVWDTIRALDYLLERGDVDEQRIGCTGASGGGLNTLYAAAIDDRIAVAAPVVYVTRLREFLETRITHCPCSHVNGLAKFMDMGDVAALIAPRPLLLITATQDSSFTPQGARRAADQARGAYLLHGSPGALAVEEFDSGHDYNRAMRETVMGWFALHLNDRGRGEPVPEPEFPLEADPAKLRCFPEGRVPAGAETVRSLARARVQELLDAPPLSPYQIRRRLTVLLGGPATAAAREVPLDPDLMALLALQDVGEPVALAPPEGTHGPLITAMRTPGLLAGGPRLIVVSEGASSPLVESVRARVSEVITLDPRGVLGEADGHLLATNALLLGDSLLAQRARAVCSALRFFGDGSDSVPATWLLAEGTGPSLIALTAVALGAPCETMAFSALPTSFLPLLDGDAVFPDMSCWQLLECGDIDDLLRATGARSVRLPSSGAEQALANLLEDSGPP